MVTHQPTVQILSNYKCVRVLFWLLAGNLNWSYGHLRVVCASMD